MRVLVTGCSGYVGSQVASRLAARGWHVVGSARRPCSLAGVEVVTGDHLDTDFVGPILDRVDTVVHFAARTRGHSPAVFRPDNEDVTAVLSREANRAGTPLVYVSSDQAVYQTGFYGQSKRACEEIVSNEGGGHAILRLSAVLGRYAPHMSSTFSKIIRRLHESAFLVVPGDGGFPIAPVWIGDVELVVRRLLDGVHLSGQTLELRGPVTTLASLLDLFEQRLGTSRRRLRVPVGPLQAIARGLKPFRPFARLPLDALLDLGRPIEVSPEGLTRLIDFEPTPMSEAVPLIPGFPAKDSGLGGPA